VDVDRSASLAVRRVVVVLFVVASVASFPLSTGAQQDTTVVSRGDSVTIRLVDVDVRAAIQALSRHLDRPVIFGAVGGGQRVTLETPRAVPRSQVVDLLRGVLQAQGLELVADSAAGAYRVQSREQARALAPPPQTPVRPQGGPPALFVIRLRHARAADVAATVNALYGRASALGERGAPPTLNEELRENRIPPAGVERPEEGVLPGRAAQLTGEVTIVPDPGTNSLLIRASQEDFDLIQAAVREVDVRPLQVLIEVVIAEVRKDRSFNFGVDASLPTSRIRGTNTTVNAQTTGIGLGDFALKIMDIGGVNLDVTLRAAASRGDVSILSRPIVLAANNEVAEILVGSQRPFVQVQRALPTDNAARDQVVQYKDVGTNLSVRPTISQDGYVMLEVMQEVNAATNEVAFDAPVISTRTVRTRLLVRDSQTVVLGGLADRQRERTHGGVPVLSSIPLLGGLFGRASRRATETELFLFLTPRIIRDDDDADRLTQPLRDKAEKSAHDE
jgi:general secretion pathway protein D